MFGILLYTILFFAIPVAFIVLFIIGLYRYVSAKKQNQVAPGTFSDEEIKKRRLVLIILSAVVGVLAAVIIGYLALMFMAISFM